MEHRKAALGRAWCVSGFALLAWLMLLAPARAGERVVADLDGDGRGDQITIDHDHGQGIRLAISSGRTFWLRADRRLLHVAAADLDRDGDLDLVATTDGPELLTWFNHRHRFARHAAVPPGMAGLLARPGPSFAALLPADDGDTGLGSGEAILATSSESAPAARSIFPDRRVPARVTGATALSESRAPPRL